jgi:hypothetical protein
MTVPEYEVTEYEQAVNEQYGLPTGPAGPPVMVTVEVNVGAS